MSAAIKIVAVLDPRKASATHSVGFFLPEGKDVLQPENDESKLSPLLNVRYVLVSYTQEGALRAHFWVAATFLRLLGTPYWRR